MGVAGSAPVQTPTLWVLLCRCVRGSKVPKSPAGNFRTLSSVPGVSCGAAGCPPEGHSSPLVSLCSLGSPWRRHLGAKAVEMLLGSCRWAAAMIPLCLSLGGEGGEKARSLSICSLNLDSSALGSVWFLFRGTCECDHPPTPSCQHRAAENRTAGQGSSPHSARRDSPFASQEPRDFTWSALERPGISTIQTHS